MAAPTGKKLVIVESPAKAKTIAGYLGKDYVVESSIGHIRDLPNNAGEIPAKYKGEAWARLGEMARDDVEAYAYARVGYHRGLDTLRAAGWRGNGYVRWRHPTNRGFLRSLAGLHRTAQSLGEADEAERTALFLRQLEPDWDRISPGPGH